MMHGPPTLSRGRSAYARRASLLIVLASLLSVLVGCTEADPSTAPRANRRVNPPPEISATPGSGAAPASLKRGPMSASDLERAFRALMEQYVDPLDHRQLLGAATVGLRESLEERGTLPLFTLPLDLQPPGTRNPSRDWQGFARAYESVTQKSPAWAAEVHPDWLVIQRMAASVDDGHTYFRTPEEVARAQESSYGGIGVGLAASQTGEGPLVNEVFANSPAERAGVRRGDRILAVSDQPLAGRSLSEVVRLIRGPSGTEVSLSIRRVPSPESMHIRVTRGQVQVEPVVALPSNDGTLAYVRIRNFQSDFVSSATRQVLQNGTRAGIRGWILDLRGNPGGSMPVVRQVAGAFVDSKPIGFEVDRQASRVEIAAEGPALLRDVKMVVLVDKDTASGAEIIAAALRDYLQVPVVGVASAGNVQVAVPVELADGSQLQVTTRRYETGKGERLDRVGVTPDIVVEQRDADLETGRDTQLNRATELLVQALRR